MASGTEYVGNCIHCGRLAELDTSTALCLDTKKCAKAAQGLPRPRLASNKPETKKEDSNGS